MAVVGAIASTIVRSIVGALTDNDLPGGAGGGGGGGGSSFGPTDVTTLASAETDYWICRNYQSLPLAVWCSPDGDYVMVQGQGGDAIDAWALSTPFDTTVLADNVAPTSTTGLNLGDSLPRGLWMNPAGTFMSWVGETAETAITCTLGTAWDMSTKSANALYDMTADGVVDPQQIFWADDGLKFYVLEKNPSLKINQFACSSEFDVTTASFTSEYDFATATSSDTGILGFFINGTEIYLNSQSDKLWKFSWTPGDITSMAIDGAAQSYTQAQVAQSGLWMNADYVMYTDYGGSDGVHTHTWGPHE